MSKTDYGIIEHIPSKLYGLSLKEEKSQKNLASDRSNLEKKKIRGLTNFRGKSPTLPHSDQCLWNIIS